MPRIAALLLEYKANPNAQQSDGNTPLHLACFKGDLVLVELLLRYGADVNIQNNVAGRTPLHVAADGYHDSIVELLLKHKANINVQDHFGKTPADYAETKEMKQLLEPQSQYSTNCTIDNSKSRQMNLIKSLKVDVENKENFMPEQRIQYTSSTLERKKKESQMISFDEYLKRSKTMGNSQPQTQIPEQPELPISALSPDQADQSLNHCENQEQIINENQEQIINENPDQILCENPDQIINENPDQIINENPDQIINENPDQIINENQEQISPDNNEEKMSEDMQAKALETLREENEELEGTIELKEMLNDSKNEPIIVLPEVLQSPPKKSARPEINEVLQYEEIAKDKSPRDTSIHYYIATSKNQSKKTCDLPLKLDTNSELYIKINENGSRPTSARQNQDSNNLNYSHTTIASTFLCEPSKAECTMKIKQDMLKQSPLNGQQSYENSIQGTSNSEGMICATFKSQKNDIPAYINDRKRLNLNKTDNKVVADIYNELLNQMQNYSKLDNSSVNNNSVEYGDSIFFETLNDNYEQFEKMVSQKEQEENKTPPKPIEDDIEKELELESPDEHHTVSMKAFPIENCGMQYLTTDKCEFSETHEQYNINEIVRRSYINEELDRWLENINLRSIGSILGKSGINTKSALTKLLEQTSYINAHKILQSNGIQKHGIRDRIILAYEQESGQFKTSLLKSLDRSQINHQHKESTIFNCCGRVPKIVPDFINPPSLKLWLGRQNFGNLISGFMKAGYDDYEWLLTQMCSDHPLTDEILMKEIGIQNAATRSRLLFKLTEGIFSRE